MADPSQQPYQAESLAIRETLGDDRGRAWVLSNLGHVHRNLADYPAARRFFRQSLALRQELGDKRGIALCLEGLAWTLILEGRLVQGVRLLDGAATLRATIQAPLLTTEQADHDEMVTLARAGLGAAPFDLAWQAG